MADVDRDLPLWRGPWQMARFFNIQGKRIKIVDLNPIFHRKRTNRVSPTLSGQAIQSRKAWNPRPKAEDSIIKPSGYALGFHANAANDTACHFRQDRQPSQA